ncbi:MAG: 3-phosphoshikimate 1-carboxyvinyltransferase [Candidatus Methylacidiphilales bacterium]
MHKLIHQNIANFNISIHLPSSKSISNRALILNAFYNHQVKLHNISEADDTQLMLTALNTTNTDINLKNAGTCMRFLAAFFAAQNHEEVNLLCSKRMEQRPIADLVNALQNLGAEISYLNSLNFPPLNIKGKILNGGNIAINASESSQFISALMLIAPFINNGLTMELLGNIASFDYIKMTALLMEKFGLTVNINNQIITIPNQPNAPIINEYTIENDWSSAAFWYLTCCLNNQISISLKTLSLNSIQGDKITPEIFKQLGVNTTSNFDHLIIQKQLEAKPTCYFDLGNCIDLAPALCVACAALNINATITGLENLVIKESNRLEAIVTELKKLGYNITFNSNTIFTHPSSFIDFEKQVTINTYSDHRIAMAFAPLALKFKNLSLDNLEVVNKSYPNFFAELAKVGIQTTSLSKIE